MNKTNKKGFTLIELLVVIAIIGILAALVLVALGNARDKAQDARIKSTIGQLRTLSEVLYDNNNSSYSSVGTCFTSGTGTGCAGSVLTSVTSLKADLTAAGGALTAKSNATNYCIESSLKSSTSQYFCADGAGNAKVNTAAKCTAVTSTC